MRRMGGSRVLHNLEDVNEEIGWFVDAAYSIARLSM